MFQADAEGCPDRVRPPPRMPMAPTALISRASGAPLSFGHGLSGRCGETRLPRSFIARSRATCCAFQRLAAWRARAARGPAWTNRLRHTRVHCGLVGWIRRGASRGPDKPRQLAGDGGDDNLLQLAPGHHLSIALAQPGLRPPGDLAHSLWHGIDRGQLVAGDAGREAVAVRSLDQEGAGVTVTGLGDGADAALAAGGVLGRHQAETGQ